MHDHAGLERLLRQMQGVKVDMTEIYVEVCRLQLPVRDGGIDATLHRKQVIIAVHLDHRPALLQLAVCLDVVKIPRRITQMRDVCLGMERRLWTKEVCASARELGVGGHGIQRVLGQEVMQVEVSYAGSALISHRVQVYVADNVCPSPALLEQGVSRELRRIAKPGVGMYGHLGEANVRQAEVAIDAAKVHRCDVPLQVSPDASTVCEVLHGACSAYINDARHQHIASLQREVVDVAVCHEVDVQRLRRITLGEVLRHVSLSKAKDILMPYGSLQVCFHLSTLLWRECVPIEVNVAAGRTVWCLQIETSRRQVLGIEGKVDGKVVELEATLLLEGKFL